MTKALSEDFIDFHNRRELQTKVKMLPAKDELENYPIMKWLLMKHRNVKSTFKEEMTYAKMSKMNVLNFYRERHIFYLAYHVYRMNMIKTK